MTDPSIGRVIVLTLLAGAVAFAAGSATPAWMPAWPLVIAASLGVLTAEVAAVIDIRMPRAGLARLRQSLAELGFLLVSAKTVALVVDGRGILAQVGAWPDGFFTGPTTITLAVAIAAWLAAGATIGDLARLGRPLSGDELEIPPLQALFVRFLGGASVILVLGSLGLTAWSELIRLNRAPVAGIVWPLLIYLPVGVLALGLARIRDAELRWESQRAVVHTAVRDRWAGRVIVVAVVVAAVLAILPAGDTSPVLRAAGAGASLVGDGLEGVIDWLRTRNPEGDADEDDIARTAPEPTIPFQDREVRPPIEPSEPLISPSARRVAERVALWVALAAVGIVIVREVVRARPVLRLAYRKGRERGVVAAVLAVLLAFPGVLADLLRSLRRGRRSERITGGVERVGGRADPAGAPETTRASATDVRSRIARVYESFTEAGSERVGRRAGSETPHEYGARVSAAVPPVRPSEQALTALFEESRFSDHPLTTEAAEAADALLDDIEGRMSTFDRESD